ncbi:MAG: alpha/beta fold hydrolase [Hyphomonadaceae bacterium]|nr:MAG: polyhydroxyalkanoate synthase [Caulobacteraceae bacterium]MBT9445986.1 alpha/beta fold hydrolase [Hyphomonadaceae bacterium]TPW06704.1 MAG: polyhydroxyalkanoate synthase [Alphaproteobacteria bacterium]
MDEAVLHPGNDGSGVALPAANAVALAGPVPQEAASAAPTASVYATADARDSAMRALFSPLTNGVSPYASLQAWADWSFHLAISPWRAAAMAGDAWKKAQAATRYAADPHPDRAQSAPFKPETGDRRFRDEAWQIPPFDALAQGHLAREAWWRDASHPLRGMRDHHARRVDFLVRQALNAMAPVNFPLTNPVVWNAAVQSGGRNFAEGAQIFFDDLARIARGEKLAELEAFRLGDTIAATPGEVVFRNEIMELIQYTPTTTQVRREPILLVPAWIMKYYILDLTPEDSLVKYLVDRGFTVFCVSWKNPGEEMRDVSFEDYRVKGVMAAIDEVSAIVPGEKIHATGYCLGGTVLATAAAAMARDGDERLATLTLLAAQTDFSEAGELMMFIGESQIAALEDIMARQGYLDARQMSSAFYVLRANEMVWARFVERYLLGHRHAGADLEFWLADPTRMPARMHSEYLRGLFMENRLADGLLEAGGRGVYLKDITAPVFVVGAERDHIAPWRSVHKTALFVGAQTTFALTGGGHNAGIVTPPGKPGAFHWLNVIGSTTDYENPDEWVRQCPRQEGSWWPAWTSWLDAHSARDRAAPPQMARAGAQGLCAAPGEYVFEI